jgi:hypothetical protein
MLSIKPPKFMAKQTYTAAAKREWTLAAKKNAAPLGAAVIATLNHIAMSL